MLKMNSVFLCALLLLTDMSNALAQSRGITLQTVQPHARTPFKGGYYRALIIGNSVYRDPVGAWPSLQTAVSDARAIGDILQKNYGFSDVKILENATRRDVLKALDRLARRALPEDNILLYYAGHGFLDDETRRGYWVPVDAEGRDSTTFLRNSTIRDELNLIAQRSRHTLLISDSCFSGSLLRTGTRGVRPAGTAGDSEKYLQKVSKKKSVQIMAAGGVEFVDDNYQSSGHSPFTYFLLNELKNNDRKMLTVSELSSSVTRMVANNVEQVPQSGVLQGAGDELGEFIFIKLDVTVDGIDPDKVRVDVNVKPGKSVPVPQTSTKPKIKIDIERQPAAPMARPHLPMPTL